MAPDDRRAAIVAATLPLVLRDGPSVSTRQIAEAAGVAEGTIFRVFPDKDALMRAVLEKGFDPQGTLDALAAVDRGMPLRERLVTTVTILQDRLRSAFGLLGALGLQGPPPQPAEHRVRDHAKMNEAFRVAVADVIGRDSGLLRVPATEFAQVLRLLTFSATHPRISDGTPMTPDAIVDVVLDGMRAAPGPRAHDDPAGAPAADHHARTIEV